MAEGASEFSPRDTAVLPAGRSGTLCAISDRILIGSLCAISDWFFTAVRGVLVDSKFHRSARPNTAEVPFLVPASVSRCGRVDLAGHLMSCFRRRRGEMMRFGFDRWWLSDVKTGASRSGPNVSLGTKDAVEGPSVFQDRSPLGGGMWFVMTNLASYMPAQVSHRLFSHAGLGTSSKRHSDLVAVVFM